jgi:hypothetical protein
MIEGYRFGSITINGRTYHHDVEVRWTSEVLKWWRKEGYIIDLDDVKRAIEEKPEIIVIGTGEMGVAKVTKKTIEEIKLNKIELIIEITGKAVKIFNQNKERKVIGLFHLTC